MAKTRWSWNDKSSYEARHPTKTFGGVNPDVAKELVIPSRLSDAALRAAFVPFWKPSTAVLAGDVRMTALGLTITRNSNGTTRASYDATEAALWTVTSGGGGGGGTVASTGITDSTAVGRAVLTAANAAAGRTAIAALGAADAVELDVATNKTLTSTGTATSLAADSGHTHRLPNADGSGDITLYTADGTAIKLHVAAGVVGAGGGGGGAAGATNVLTSGRMHFTPWFSGTTAQSSTGITANQTYGVPIYLPAGTVTRLAAPPPGGSAVAGTARVGIFTLNKAAPENSTLLIDAGTWDLGNPAAAPSVTLSQVVAAGWYILAVAPQSVHQMYSLQNGYGLAAPVYSGPSNPIPSYGWLGAGSISSAFGATFGGTGVGNNIVPLIGVEMTIS